MVATAPYQKHSPTSREAARFVTRFSGTARERVFLEILRSGNSGITDESLAIKLNMNPSTVRPRRVELQQAALIQPALVTHKGASGMRATAWIATGFPYNAVQWQQSKNPPLQHMRVVRDFRNGKSSKDLCTKYNLSIEAVEDIIRRWIRRKR